VSGDGMSGAPLPLSWVNQWEKAVRTAFGIFSCLSLRNGGGGEIILFYLDGEGGLEKSRRSGE